MREEVDSEFERINSGESRGESRGRAAGPPSRHRAINLSDSDDDF